MFLQHLLHILLNFATLCVSVYTTRCILNQLFTCDAKTVNILTGEASASTMWDNQAWSYLHRDREEAEPPFLVQDFIHTVQPSAKIIIMLRDPVERYCREIHPHICLYRHRCDFLWWNNLALIYPERYSCNLSLL